jgi:hypothetical protein
MAGQSMHKITGTISRGSEWHRWDPHIHAPGTILNDQFGSIDPWDTYLSAIENRMPRVEAIGVADYYLTEPYEELLRQKAAGRLVGVKLIFPNELRLDVAAKSGFVNIHLLVSPEDPDHLAEVKRILKRLQFCAYNDRFDCTREELIKLGKRADPSLTDEGAALRHGATQFKVNFDQLRKVIHESDWAKRNILIAVAGGASDGTSGVRQAADATVRQEIEKFGISSSQAAQHSVSFGSVRGSCPRRSSVRDMTAANPASMGATPTTKVQWLSPLTTAFHGSRAHLYSMLSVRLASTLRAAPTWASSRRDQQCLSRSFRISKSIMRSGPSLPTSRLIRDLWLS